MLQLFLATVFLPLFFFSSLKANWWAPTLTPGKLQLFSWRTPEGRDVNSRLHHHLDTKSVLALSSGYLHAVCFPAFLTCQHFPQTTNSLSFFQLVRYSRPFCAGRPWSCLNAHNNQTMAWVVFGARSSMDGTSNSDPKIAVEGYPKKKNTTVGPSQRIFHPSNSWSWVFFWEAWQSRNVFWTLQ